MRITVRGKGSFTAEPGDTILEAGRRAGFGFPHACRNGNCHRCQGTLLAGKVRQQVGNLVGNRTWITAGDAQAGQVLYCVAHAQSDCEIDVSDITAPGQLPVFEVVCQIVAIDPLNHDVSRVLLRLPAGKKVRWHAGQYLCLLLSGDNAAAFSIANACTGRDIELHIRHVPSHASAQEIIEYLEGHSTVRVRLPDGGRCLGERLPERPLWFICGSTGFAPVKAMMEELLRRGFDQPVHLYWGARLREDMYLESLAQHWAATTNLHFVAALSEEKQDGYETGVIHEAVLRDLRRFPAGEFHVAGSPAMAWAVHDALVAAGIPSHDIHSDVFDYAPRD